MLSIKYLIVSLADAYSMVLFVYVLMSWFPTDPRLEVWWTLRPSSPCLYYNLEYVY